MSELKNGCVLYVGVRPTTAWVSAAVAAFAMLALALHAQSERVRLNPQGGTRPEYARHPMQYITTKSNLAFTGIGPALAIFDVSNANNPVLRGGYITTGYVHRVEVIGSHAYVAAQGVWDGFHYQNALEILDVSDPAGPVRVGYYDASASGMDVQVAANRAYLASGGTWSGSNFIGALEILDVADPAHPSRLGGIATGSALQVHVAGNLAYVVANDGLEIIDVSNPIAPLRVGIYKSGQVTEGSRVTGDRGYLAGQRWTGTNWIGNLEIVDLTHPTNLTRMGSYDTRGYAHDVHVIGSTVFLAGGVLWTGSNEVGNTLEILDTTNPTNAVLLGTYRTAAPAFSIQVAGDYAYLASDYAGLQIIDIRHPLNPTHVGDFDPTGFTSDVQIVDHYAFLSELIWNDTNTEGTLEIYDVSDPAQPERLGRYIAPGAINGVHVVGSHAYLATSASFAQTNNIGSMEIVDVSNPAFPVRVGGVTAGGSANHLQVVGQFAYVASAIWTGSNRVGALEVFNVANPTNPVHVATYDTAGAAYDVQVVGSRAYLADGVADLLVLDVSNPANPAFLGSYSTNVDNPWTGEPGGPSVDVEVAGSHVFAVGADGLHVLDVSNPADPVRVSGFGLALSGIHVSGKYAFAFSAMPNGLGPPVGFLAIFDVTDPENFVLVSGDDPGAGWIASKIQMVSNRVYVAAGNAGLLIFDLESMQIPSITSVAREGNKLVVSWPGAPGLKLQRTESLDDAIWTDVSDSDGESRIELPIGNGHEFFRLSLDW